MSGIIEVVRSLAAFPGRARLAARMTVVVSCVMLAVLWLGLPAMDIAAYVALFTCRRRAAETMRLGIVFAVIALAIFVRGSNWAWGVGGIIASAFAAMGIAGQAMGWVAGLLIAGVVLLVVSGLLLVARRRVEAREAPTSDPAR